jgi:serine/threonine protein kinase
MVSELMACSLLDILKTGCLVEDKPALSQKVAVRYAVQLSQGMNYLHTCNPPIIHRDLKPENLLLDYSGTIKVWYILSGGVLLATRASQDTTSCPLTVPMPRLDAQVADFGLARLRPERTPGVDPTKTMMTGETGSYRFMAPEIFRHEAYDECVTLRLCPILC